MLRSAFSIVMPGAQHAELSIFAGNIRSPCARTEPRGNDLHQTGSGGK
jgi:hypothetical protein